MALIHRCDRCSKDFPDQGYLHPVLIGRPDARRDDINDNRVKRFPLHDDLCGDCVVIVLLAATKPVPGV